MSAIRGLGRLLSVGAALGVALLVSPAAALADCAAPLPPEKAVFEQPVVFVGTVTDVRFGGLSATVRVDEVWAGEVGDEVTVDGGMNPAAQAEDDRFFEAGVRYLFMPNVVDGRLVDGLCTPTTPWDDSYAAFRPDIAHAPESGATSSSPLDALGDLALPLVMAAVIGGGAILLSVVVARRRES
jgi:hypothetical protein